MLKKITASDIIGLARDRVAPESRSSAVFPGNWFTLGETLLEVFKCLIFHKKM